MKEGVSYMKSLFDLSQPFDVEIPVYHIYTKPMFGIYHFHKENGFYDRMTSFYTHSGTHIDAPKHFSEKGYSLDEIPLSKLVGPGVVLSIPKKELGEITAEDLDKAALDVNFKKGDIVIINTGWHKNWKHPDYSIKFPGIVKSAAEWLVEHDVNMVGVDWICIDHPSQTDMGDSSWIAHRIVLSNNIPVIENVGGQLDEVTNQRIEVMALPVKVVNGDGFPIRIVAALN